MVYICEDSFLLLSSVPSNSRGLHCSESTDSTWIFLFFTFIMEWVLLMISWFHLYYFDSVCSLWSVIVHECLAVEFCNIFSFASKPCCCLWFFEVRYVNTVLNPYWFPTTYIHHFNSCRIITRNVIKWTFILFSPLANFFQHIVFLTTCLQYIMNMFLIRSRYTYIYFSMCF